MTRRLRMPYLRNAAVDVVPTARANGGIPPSCCGCCSRGKSPAAIRPRCGMRRRQANFPAGKTFAVWDEQRCSIPAPT
jgi:hypothetical protein